MEWVNQWKWKRRQMTYDFTFPLANQLHAHMQPIKGEGEITLIKINQPLLQHPEELVQERGKMFDMKKSLYCKESWFSWSRAAMCLRLSPDPPVCSEEILGKGENMGRREKG